jgi:DNA-binding CsgD family transcriptional regulator
MQAAMRLDEVAPTSSQADRPVQLSARELAVLHYLSYGESDARIARELGIGKDTIRTYVDRAKTKLRVKTRSHAVGEAMRRLLIK